MKFFSTFVSVGILMIFGTILGIQLDKEPSSDQRVSMTEVSNFSEEEMAESKNVESVPETDDEEEVVVQAEKSILSKLGQGLNHTLSGISEKAVSGLE